MPWPPRTPTPLGLDLTSSGAFEVELAARRDRNARAVVNRTGPAPFADSLLTEPPERFRRRESRRETSVQPTACKVSRLGIEPRTLGLKGQARLSHRVAGLRKLSQP